MTDRLYYRDAYLTEFSARVVARSDDGLRVTLDQTAFYPTSGGQQFDTGTLNDARVIDVREEEDGITHLLEVPLTGEEVRGRVDWERRFDHMQQHTGQHVLSAVFEDLFGYRTASVHFGAEYSTVDLETERLSRERVLEAEARANRIVFDDIAVAISFEDAATATGLRKPPPREGELRVVSIMGIDRSACGGTHVRATGEIGPILLRKHDRMHGNARIEFLCGARAVQRSRADFDALARVSAALGISPDETPLRVETLLEELKNSERARKKTDEELAVFRARAAYDSAASDAQGVRWLIERITRGSLDDVRAMAHAAVALPKAAFIGIVDDPPQLLLATSEDSGLEAGKLVKAALTAVGGRGGGSARIAQGSVPAGAIETVIDQLGAPANDLSR